MAEEQNDAQQTQQIRLQVDERGMETKYANAFRTHPMPDEVMIDFGMNFPMMQPAAEGEEPKPGILLKVDTRVVMNYYSAKRLAMTLGQLISRHEQQFGELELDASKRQIKKS